MSYVAFFDLDETLIAENSGKVFWEYCLKHKVYSPFDMGFIALALLKFLTGFDETEEFIRNWAACFKGWQVDRMQLITAELFDERIRHLIRPQAQQEIRKHRDMGARTVILSASTRFVCEPVCKHLEMDAVLCTGLGIENGIFTGALEGPYIFGEQKYLSALAYCSEQGFDMTQCYYYGDAFTDRHVMEAVGNPICVTPDRKLKEYARDKSWKIVQW